MNSKQKIASVTSVFKRNLRAKTTVVLNEGGARSSKSYSVCQLFIYKLTNETGKTFLVTRKYLPGLRITAYKLFIDLLKEYGYYNEFDHNKTMRTYALNNNLVFFTSIDEPTKLQSTEFNYIWMEEAEEFTFDDFAMLKTRLSGRINDGKINQIFLTYNPKNENSYINKRLSSLDGVTLIKSTYMDNPNVQKSYVDELENLKKLDERFWRVYGLGEYAMIEGQIYTHVKSTSVFPESYDFLIYGVDFGYNNPACILKIGIKDKVFYVTELLYCSKLTNADLIRFMKENIPENSYVYADSAEPARIEEIRRSKFKAVPAKKNVCTGIDFVKQCEIFTQPGNVNFNRELRDYVWAVDKQNGNILDEPVKFNDHAMDALRYAIYTNGIANPKKDFPKIIWI